MLGSFPCITVSHGWMESSSYKTTRTSSRHEPHNSQVIRARLGIQFVVNYTTLAAKVHWSSDLFTPCDLFLSHPFQSADAKQQDRPVGRRRGSYWTRKLSGVTAETGEYNSNVHEKTKIKQWHLFILFTHMNHLLNTLIGT
jgi:hypothetical protein